MRNIYLKYRCLVSGFPAVKEKYEIENFKLCYLNIDFDNLELNKSLKFFDLNAFLLFCQYKLEEDDKYYINYFESKELKKVNISDDDYDRISNKEIINLKKYNEVFDEIKL